MDLPSAFQERILRVHGDAGRQWLRDFPATCAALCKRWRISLGTPLPLSYNFVALAERGPQRLVLKLGVPNAELTGEIDSLLAFAGRGAARVFEADAAQGDLLLENIEPGTPLSALEDDDRATAIAAELLSRLWFEPPQPQRFRSVHQAMRSLRRLARLAPHFVPSPLRSLLEQAGLILDELEAVAVPPAQGSVPTALLLHADFHHGNVLLDGAGQWRVIDSKGAVGDCGFDLGPLLRNRLLGCDDPATRLARRVERLARELALSPESVLRWAFLGAMTSCAWALEDGEPPEPHLAAAALMASALALPARPR